MAKQKEEKTTVRRLLEQRKIPYIPHTYPCDGQEAPDGAAVAAMLGQDPAAVFKTLVARGAAGGVYVFVVPVEESLDLKKAARAVGEKAIAMVHVSEINGLTGYVRGGCSPVGMKKRYPTVFHASALEQAVIMVSAGKIGWQVALSPRALMDLVEGTAADIIAG